MAQINILKTDSRGRITLPPPFRSEPLFEYIVDGDQLTLYPVRTVRKFPDMTDLPEQALADSWIVEEQRINADSRSGVVASSPDEALRKFKG